MGWMVPERSMALCNSGLSLPVCSWVCASFRLYNSNCIWIQHIHTILCFNSIVFCQYCNIIVTFTITESCHVHHIPLDSCLANAQRAPAATSRTRGAWEHGCPAQGVLSSHLLCIGTSITQHWNSLQQNLSNLWRFASTVSLPPFIPQNIQHYGRHDTEFMIKPLLSARRPVVLKRQPISKHGTKGPMSIHLKSSELN